MRVVTDFSVVSARRVRPSGPALSLDFAAGSFLAKGKPKTLAEVISFTRAGSALRLTSGGVLESLAANQPRLDHTEAGAARGLLIEPAATNLMLNNITTICPIWWQAGGNNPPAVPTTLRGLAAKSYTRTNNTFCNPDTPNAVAVTPGQAMVFSFWAASPNAAQIRPAVFNSTAGTWILGHVFSDTTITLEPGGRRYSFAFTVPAGCTSIQPKFDYSAVSATGATIIVTAPQVEIATLETSTIITGASAVTRAADVPGVLGLTGTHDVTLTYDDLSVQTLTGQTITPGWWPAMSRPWLRSMQVA